LAETTELFVKAPPLGNTCSLSDNGSSVTSEIPFRIQRCSGSAQHSSAAGHAQRVFEPLPELPSFSVRP